MRVPVYRCPDNPTLPLTPKVVPQNNLADGIAGGDAQPTAVTSDTRQHLPAVLVPAAGKQRCSPLRHHSTYNSKSSLKQMSPVDVVHKQLVAMVSC